jgi:hypothetical protein
MLWYVVIQIDGGEGFAQEDKKGFTGPSNIFGFLFRRR